MHPLLFPSTNSSTAVPKTKNLPFNSLLIEYAGSQVVNKCQEWGYQKLDELHNNSIYEVLKPVRVDSWYLVDTLFGRY